MRVSLQMIEPVKQKIKSLMYLLIIYILQTQLARAVAGEAQAAFLSVAPSDILSKFVGESEASIRNFFKEGELM